MEWPKFDVSNVELPNKYLEKIIQSFSVATKELADLAIREFNDLSRIVNNKLETRFLFKVDLISSKLSNFSMTVFEFGYDPTLYPVAIEVSRSLISKGNGLSGGVVFLNSATEFQEYLERIFKSDKFVETVTGIMKIAEETDDFPF